MSLANIAAARLISQQIAGTKFRVAKDLVDWMGAMQAQDYAMAKWAVGIRLPGSTERVVETAIDNGEILRTHLLRPTWHLVSANDIHWMLELTAPKIKASLKSRDRELELSEAILTKSNTIIEKTLGGGRTLTRDEIIDELKKAKIATGNNRASHLLVHAELDGIICSGAIKGRKQTYALLEERVPQKKRLTREDALTTLAKRYFSSLCPATLQDFTWWSGLSAGDAKRASEMVKSDFILETIDSRIYWVTHSFSFPKTDNESVYLLPAFDEFIISYSNRAASLPFEGKRKAVSDNGIFRPTIVVNGQVMGIWKRTIKKDKVLVETSYFQKPDKPMKGKVEQAALLYKHFINSKS
ncbi:MAG TPA: winged helix DNA-binding domain-containing protein [Longilinea sp.]|nr:winged helix DNA-binding domain-containing protein [Longilinea sp.]